MSNKNLDKKWENLIYPLGLFILMLHCSVHREFAPTLDFSDFVFITRTAISHQGCDILNLGLTYFDTWIKLCHISYDRPPHIWASFTSFDKQDEFRIQSKELSEKTEDFIYTVILKYSSYPNTVLVRNIQIQYLVI